MLETVLERNTQLLEENNRLLARLIELQSATPVVIEETVVSTDDAIQEAIAADPAPPKEPTTTKKTKPAKDPEPAAADPEPAAADPEPEYSISDVRSALVVYTDGKGKAASLRLLSRYHASKLSEVDPSHYADIINEVKQAVRQEVSNG